MKKSQKKIENALIAALTTVCEMALDQVAGFKWITHLVNYSDYPNSLAVVCIFDTNEELSNAVSANQDDYLRNCIKTALNSVNIRHKNIAQQVSFDTEEACQNENDGRWSERFRRFKPDHA